MESRSRRREAAACFPKLSPGVQNGLSRLVSDNTKTVAEMLDCDDSSLETLREKCAGVMKQQQLSPEQFLARFFETDILAEYSTSVLDKSSKGTSVQLAERIAKEWAKNTPLLPSKPSNSDRKRKDIPMTEKEVKEDQGTKEKKIKAKITPKEKKRAK